MIKVKIPKEVKVGGFTYKIELDKHRQELRSASCWGKSKSGIQEIWIDSDVPEQRLSECFIHEYCHAISDVSGMPYLVEEQVRGLGNGLLQLFEQLGIRFTK